MLLVKMMVLMKMMVNIAMNDGDTRRLIFQLYWNTEDVFCACFIFCSLRELSSELYLSVEGRQDTCA